MRREHKADAVFSKRIAGLLVTARKHPQSSIKFQTFADDYVLILAVNRNCNL